MCASFGIFVAEFVYAYTEDVIKNRTDPKTDDLAKIRENTARMQVRWERILERVERELGEDDDRG